MKQKNYGFYFCITTLLMVSCFSSKAQEAPQTQKNDDKNTDQYANQKISTIPAPASQEIPDPVIGSPFILATLTSQPAAIEIDASGSTLLNSVTTSNELLSPGELALVPEYALGKGSPIQPGSMTAHGIGAPIKINGLFIYPSALLYVGNNSNIIGTNSSVITSPLENLQPNIVIEEKYHGNRYTASYQGNYTRYSTSPVDDTDHHQFQLAGDMLFTHRAKLGWNLGLDIDSDPRGSTDHNLSPSPDIWHASTISSLFTYGSDGAIGRIETEAMLEHKRYVNNPETTAGYNLDESDLATRFIYRVAPATSLLIEVRQINSDYQLSTSPNTNTDRRLLLGIIWHANTFTSASFKIGAVRKNFIDSDYSNYSGLNWDGKFNWSPLRTSALELSTTQVCSDSSGEGQYIVNRTFEADWTHSWSAFAQSHLNLIQTTSDYYGAVRQDRTTSYSVEADYLLRRWLKLGVGFTQTRRSSTQADIPFIRNILFLNVMGSL